MSDQERLEILFTMISEKFRAVNSCGLFASLATRKRLSDEALSLTRKALTLAYQDGQASVSAPAAPRPVANEPGRTVEGQ